MQSPEMLKSKIPIFASWGGGWWPTFDAESRNAKIQFLQGEGGNKLLILSPELLKSKIPIFAWGVGSQLLMQSPVLIRSKLPFLQVRGGWWPTFDAESRNTKIQNSNFHRGGWGGGGRDWWTTFDAEPRNANIQNSNFHRWEGGEVGGQLLMLSPEMLKSKIPIFAWGWGLGGVGSQLLMQSPVLIKSKLPFLQVTGVVANF